MRNTRWILLLAALAGALWLYSSDRGEAAGGDDGPVVSAQPDDASASSGYRITGANWSTDRTRPAYVPPHQRRVLTDAPRRKADAAARILDERTPLEEATPVTRKGNGVVIDPVTGEVTVE
jgi:hypothetical protein